MNINIKILTVSIIIIMFVAVCFCAITSLRSKNLILKSKCTEDGLNYRHRIENLNTLRQFTRSPEFFYNSNINTCLYFDSYEFSLNNNGEYYYTYFITDIYSNKIIIEYKYRQDYDKQIGNTTKEQFNETYKVLFKTKQDII